jgi:ribonuclease Z
MPIISKFQRDGIHWDITSVGGVGTSLYLRWGSGPKNAILVDAGKLPEDDRRVFGVDNILLTHTHTDHIQRILELLACRDRIGGMKDGATIYVPPGTGDKVKLLIDAFYLCDDSISPHNIVEVKIDKLIGFFGESNNLSITPFKTFHRVPSVGYRIQKYVSEIKPEHIHLDGKEKGRLGKLGELYNQHWVDIAAITGDTTTEVYHEPNNMWIKNVRTLVTEMTFLDKETSISDAQNKGHIHLDELDEIKFNNRLIVGYHFSARYKKEHILELVNEFANRNSIELDNIYMACDYHS